MVGAVSGWRLGFCSSRKLSEILEMIKKFFQTKSIFLQVTPIQYAAEAFSSDYKDYLKQN